jgi:hypothetical protein
MPKKKETVIPPSKKALKDAAIQTARGHSSGARVLGEQSTAKKQGAKRRK